MDIVEKLLTGNFGYGSIILIVGILVGLYYAIIEPRMKDLEQQKKEKDETIKSLRDDVKAKEEQLEKALDTVAEQQQSISHQSDALNKASSLTENLVKIETMEQLINQLAQKVEGVDKTVKDSAKEVTNELNRDGHIIVTLKEQVERFGKDYSDTQTTVLNRIKSIEDSLQQIASSKYSDQSDLAAKFSSLVSDINDLKSLIAMQRSSFTRGSHGYEDVGMMQDLK